MQFQIEQADANITVHPMPTVTGDRVMLELIFENLLSNAVKYLAPERPGHIEVLADNHESETVFHIRDNGRGIREPQQKRIFQLFFRASPDDTDGEGIGLAYVQALVHRRPNRSRGLQPA